MKTSFGYIDQGFRPCLKTYTDEENKKFVDYWQFPDYATPAPVDDSRFKAAVWIGKNVTKFEESPIIAVALPKSSGIEYYGHHWFVGMEQIGWNNGEFGKASNELELAVAGLAGAQHGPLTFYRATTLLKSFVKS